MAERIAEVGYINEKLEHALISIYELPLLSASADSVQIVLTIDGALELRARLDVFLKAHVN